MPKCALTTYQTLRCSVHWREIPLNISSLSHSPQHWDLTTQMLNSGILHAPPILVMLFNCLAFPKVTTFTCSFGVFDVNVSVFSMSFSRADVRCLGLVRAAEGLDRHQQSILSRHSVIFAARHSLLIPPGLINETGSSNRLQNRRCKAGTL